ncbi:MAG: hypothetical protein ACKV2T_19305 [Kofleriaceae bacterium]
MRRSLLTLLLVPSLALAQPSTAPLGAPAATVGSPAPPPPAQNHVAIEGWLSMGILAAVGGSIQYERGEIGDTTWIVRAETLLAGPIGGGPERLSTSLVAGGRAYWGPLYVDGELGLSLIRVGGYDDGLGDPTYLHYDVWPAGRLGFGVHGAGLDLGLAIGVPAFGLGIHLGIDLGHW